MPAPVSSRYVPLAAAPEQRHDGEAEECCYAATTTRYVPLRRRRGEQDQAEYAARRALFLQSYRFTTAAVSAGERDDGGVGGGGLRGRVARRVREAVARAVSRARGAARWWVGGGVGVARAWPRVGWWWRPPSPRARLGCFGGGGGGHSRSKLHYLHHFA
uniref:Uncharacterized protein n=1 Tax=Oryza rufipogon TaxID=4529 RepID=A0A0E0QTU7_ORYRU